MELIVSGLDPNKPLFKHLWGRYPFGFKPWTHCIQGLVTRDAQDVRPTMKDGKYKLQDNVFYLCGVGQDVNEKIFPDQAKRNTNVHLAVYPRKDSVAAIGSAYGVTFTIEDALAIPIEKLPLGFMGLPAAHTNCKNFQFGYQVFEAGEVSTTAGEVITKLRERWRDTPGFTLASPR